MLGWLLIMLQACGQGDPVVECNQLIAIMNPAIAELADAADDTVDDYAAGQQRLKRMQARAQQAADDTRALRADLRASTLQDHADRYATLCDTIAQLTGELAGAMVTAADTAAQAAQMDAALQGAVDGVVTACKDTARAAACRPVMAALVDIPESFSDPDAIASHAEAVRATRGSDATLNAAVNRFADTLDEARALHSQIQDLQKSTDNAHSQLEAASSEQEQLVNTINSDCSGSM